MPATIAHSNDVWLSVEPIRMESQMFGDIGRRGENNATGVPAARLRVSGDNWAM